MTLRLSLVRAALSWALLCATLALDPSWVLRVKDGDTFVIRNAGITNSEDVRVCHLVDGQKALCVNTPETGTEGAAEAKTFTEAWLHAGDFVLTACKRDSFGRLLGMVTRGEENLGTALLDQGHATIYTRKAKVTPP